MFIKSILLIVLIFDQGQSVGNLNKLTFYLLFTWYDATATGSGDETIRLIRAIQSIMSI